MENSEVKSYWISSHGHQEKYAEVVKANQGIRRLLGVYKMSEDFPHIKNGHQKLPSFTERFSTLKLESQSIIIGPYDPNLLQRKYHRNIQYDFEAEISYESIIGLKKYLNPNPIRKSYNPEWIDITYTTNEGNHTILIFQEPKRLTKPETQELFNEIRNRMDSYLS